MLRRRAKRRYLALMYNDHPDVVSAIAKRCSELFGHVTLEKASIRLVRSGKGATIIRCRLDQLDSVLASIALIEPPVMTLDMSASAKRLKRRL